MTDIWSHIQTRVLALNTARFRPSIANALVYLTRERVHHGGCKRRSSPLGKLTALPQNPLAGFERPLRGGGRGERAGRKQGRKERMHGKELEGREKIPYKNSYGLDHYYHYRSAKHAAILPRETRRLCGVQHPLGMSPIWISPKRRSQQCRLSSSCCDFFR